jgi:hypothetical protein
MPGGTTPAHSAFPAQLAEIERQLAQINAWIRNSGQVFAQLATSGEAKISTGLSEVEFPGGSEASNVKTITGLPGTTTGQYFVQPIEAAGNARYVDVVSPGPTSFGVVFHSTVGAPPAGTKEKFYWLALNE